jgi:hypothetical protein
MTTLTTMSGLFSTDVRNLFLCYQMKLSNLKVLSVIIFLKQYIRKEKNLIIVKYDVSRFINVMSLRILNW